MSYQRVLLPLPGKCFIYNLCLIQSESLFFRDNQLLTHRLHLFILRDIVAVRESLSVKAQTIPFPLRLESQAMAVPRETDVTMTNLIVRSLVTYDIRQLHLVDAIRTFLGACALHFCSELYNFANSPYDISDYDRNVRYAYRLHDIEWTVK